MKRRKMALKRRISSYTRRKAGYTTFTKKHYKGNKYKRRIMAYTRRKASYTRRKGGYTTFQTISQNQIERWTVIMFNVDLKSNICEFINKFGKVSSGQIRMMFKDYAIENVTWCLKSLLYERAVLTNGEFLNETNPLESNEIVLQSNKKFITTKHLQELITTSAWIPASFGAKNLRSYIITEYPFQTFFVTENDELYDVSVIYPGVAIPTIAAAKRVSNVSLYKDVLDPTHHIAVCFYEDDLEKVRKSGVFDYAVLLKNPEKTGVSLIEV